MRMDEAMAALSGGQVVNTEKLFGGANQAPGGGAPVVAPQERSERPVSLG